MSEPSKTRMTWTQIYLAQYTYSMLLLPLIQLERRRIRKPEKVHEAKETQTTTRGLTCQNIFCTWSDNHLRRHYQVMTYDSNLRAHSLFCGLRRGLTTVTNQINWLIKICHNLGSDVRDLSWQFLSQDRFQWIFSDFHWIFQHSLSDPDFWVWTHTTIKIHTFDHF